MKYVFLDGDKILSIADLHRAFAEALDLPDYYGKNLDALHDCLTEIREPVSVIAVNTSLLKEHVGRRWNAFLRLMDDLQDDAPDFRFTAEPEKKENDVLLPDGGSYQDANAAAIDRWIEEGWEWGVPVTHETFERAKAGDWDVLLTPTKPVPKEWFGDMKGKKVLGLASGGGQQMPVFCALGAECTVLDYSDRQLQSEREVAEREGYEINIVKADMSRPLPFPDDSFDLIFHPVANVYVREVKPIWRECFRVLKPGGVLLAGLDNGINYIVDEDEEKIVNALPFDPLQNEDQMRRLREQDCGVQFSHTAEEQLGGQLEAGFILTDLYEDTNGEGRLHELRIPSFYATRAVKPGAAKQRQP